MLCNDASNDTNYINIILNWLILYAHENIIITSNVKLPASYIVGHGQLPASYIVKLVTEQQLHPRAFTSILTSTIKNYAQHNAV